MFLVSERSFKVNSNTLKPEKSEKVKNLRILKTRKTQKTENREKKVKNLKILKIPKNRKLKFYLKELTQANLPQLLKIRK